MQLKCQLKKKKSATLQKYQNNILTYKHAVAYFRFFKQLP